MDLVMTMVDYSEPKMAAFRNSVRAFKSNEAPARDMIYTIYSVLNSDQESTVRIAKDVAGLFASDAEKQKSVLEAINEFKIDVSLTAGVYSKTLKSPSDAMNFRHSGTDRRESVPNLQELLREESFLPSG